MTRSHRLGQILCGHMLVDFWLMISCDRFSHVYISSLHLSATTIISLPRWFTLASSRLCRATYSIVRSCGLPAAFLFYVACKWKSALFAACPCGHCFVANLWLYLNRRAAGVVGYKRAHIMSGYREAVGQWVDG